MSADRPRFGQRIIQEVKHTPGDIARGAASELPTGYGFGGAVLVEGVVGGVVGVLTGIATMNPAIGLAAGIGAGTGVNALLFRVRGSYMRHNPEAILQEKLFEEQLRRIDRRQPNMTPQEEQQFLDRLRRSRRT